MRFAMAQINPTLGDVENNSQKILSSIERAAQKRCPLVIFSELTLIGYPPNDLLEREEIYLNQEKALRQLIKKIPDGITAIVGGIKKSPVGRPFTNSAFVLQKNKIVAVGHKQLLPSYDIFDETRFFEPGKSTLVVSIKGVGRIAVTICEDMWSESVLVAGRKVYQSDPFKQLKKSKVDLLVNISASPFSLKHAAERKKISTRYSKKFRAPFVYVNQVGAQDELIFDGASFATDEKGKVFAESSFFEEDLLVVDLKEKKTEHRPTVKNDDEKIRIALRVGIRDFVEKSGMSRVHLGLSGGVDSAVVAALAVDALGPGRVRGILMPGPFSSKGSVDDALALAKNLKIETVTLPIGESYELLKESLGKSAKEDLSEVLLENLQSRLRGLALMSLSNQWNSLLLNTSNKSEIAAGYSTLYGDQCGGLGVIGDLTKEWVYRLAKNYNSGGSEIVPQATIDKEPSAELKPNQKDSDSLPPYPVLDQLVDKIVTERKLARTPDEKWLLGKLFGNEFKRWQFPPILRVTDHAFGRGRRFPIAHKLKPN